MSPPLVVGNWKMHGNQADCIALARKITTSLVRFPLNDVEIVIAPPFTALSSVKRALGTGRVGLAAQNCHWESSGAFTGEVSPLMLIDIGCKYVILGHSERRHIFHEADIAIARKLNAALRNGLRPILCVGETLSERKSAQTTKVITRQLRLALKGLAKDAISNCEIAYEPVWAIGTGQNATPQQVCQVHKRIRQLLVRLFGRKGEQIRILYGGSVKPDNAAGLTGIAEVGGLLVGGASLKAETFLPIVKTYGKK
jgi:triosephosphate isomerase